MGYGAGSRRNRLHVEPHGDTKLIARYRLRRLILLKMNFDFVDMSGLSRDSAIKVCGGRYVLRWHSIKRSGFCFAI